MTSTHSGEAGIRAILDARVAATRSKDAAGATASFAEDAVVFDVVDPLVYHGANAIRGRAVAWFSTFRDASIGYELEDVTIAVDGRVAHCHSLNHAYGSLASGGRLDMWWRETICFEERDSRWLITHSHDSVPFNPETGKPSLNLKP
jgi:uncharacterized protein (TIGR02246 family)